MHHFQKPLLAASAIAALSAMAASAATTPYDLIRPTWPLSWDSTEFENFDDTTGVEIIGALPKEVVPPNFKAGELMADTVDQAYLDAINQKISPIRINQAGYLKSDKERQFYYVGDAKEFEVVDAKGKSLNTKVTGKFTATSYTTASDWTIKAGTDTQMSRYSINFTGPSGTIQIGNIPQSVPTETRLRIKVGDELSSTFIVSEDVYTMVKDAAIKFFGIQRSGNSESWFHGPSHTKDGAGPVVSSSTSSDAISPKAGDLQGGWYDCGDHLKESQTMAYAFMTLAVMSATNPDKDVDHYAYNQADFVNTDKVPDMLREAKHGADFFLRAYKVAKGVIDNMAVSIGAFGSDHSFWSRPEVQDGITVADRGGPAEREVRLGELGSNVSGEIAAGLAILGKNYATYDKKFADSCLKVAEEMYDFAKNLALGNPTYGDKKKFNNNTIAAGWGTPAYMGNNEYSDDMALASVALLFATGKEEYLDDALRSTEVAEVNEARTGAGFFEGGWFASGDMNSLVKNAKNTSWANSHAFALYALYKLILSDKDQAETFGLSEEERLNAIEDCIANMIANLGDMSTAGTGKIELPEGGIGWKQNTVAYDPTWFFMLTDQDWIYNQYYAGNVFEVLAYADVAADIEKQGLKLPNMETSGWKASEMHQLGINQLNYLLGVNPWDVSFIYGVGDKNDNHPHHRASNPEGRNSLNFEYKYVRPVGALFGGPAPKAPYSWEPSGKSWEDYHLSEVCLDASASLISALTFVSNGGSKYYEKKCDNCGKNDPNPFATDTFYVKSYIYDWAGLDMLSLRVYNNTTNDLDSITVYLYFNATEEEALGIESTDNTIGTCNIIFDLDMCVSYDNAGFVKAASIDNDTRSQMRETHPIKLEDSYNQKDKTYIWKMPVFLGTIPSGSMFQADIGTSSGIRQKNTCEPLREPSKVDIRKGWSFAAHEAEDGKPAFDGVPVWDKEQGNVQEPPRSPYIVAERNDKRLWGYAPGDTLVVPADTTKSEGIIASIPSMHIGSLHVAGRTLIAQAPAQGTKTLKVFDLLGNEVMSETFSGESATVNLSNVSKRGTLVARLTMNGKVLTTKAIRIK